jgi:hypothetical protein
MALLKVWKCPMDIIFKPSIDVGKLMDVDEYHLI